MSDESQYLWHYHLERYCNGQPEQRTEAFGYLMAQGAAIVPWLEDALEAGRTDRNTLHLAALLAQLGAPRSLRLLLRVGEAALTSKLLRTLEARASGEDIKALIAVLEAFGSRGLRAVFVVGFVGEITEEVAIDIAERLVRMAERDPKPELRAALPLLHTGILRPNAPLKFRELRKRLKTALGDALPIPATAPPSSENLPIPHLETKSEK